jgi:hypothetical protein
MQPIASTAMIIKRPEQKTDHSLVAISCFGDFWLENERLLQEEAHAKESFTTSSPEEDHAELLDELHHARHSYEEAMMPTFRYMCVVMLFAIVERELLRLVENLSKDPKASTIAFESQKGSVLKPVTRFCEESHSIRLHTCPDYVAVRELQMIRDCVVHCRGQVDLFNKARRPALIHLKDRRPGFVASEGMAIEIERVCISRFLKEIWQFFLWVFENLNWRVEDHWKQRKWT